MIQERYGWEDDHVKRIPFLRFEEIIETIIEARRDEEKERLVEVAYGQWCAYNLHFMLKKGSKHMTFKAYRDAMGLGKKPKLQWEEKTSEEIASATARIQERHGRKNGQRRSLQDRSEDPDKCKDGNN